MKTIELSQATSSLADYARGVGTEPLVVVENGTPVAALVPLEDEDVDSISLSTDTTFLRLIREARAQWQTGQSLSADEVRQKLGID